MTTLQPGPGPSLGAAALLGSALALLVALPSAHAAPVLEHQQHQVAEYYGENGCYYNFQHYDEGDRIITNEPCLNCTCHNRMLMCYLRVCPFTKAIGQDCTIEKKPDQCCPVITCPEVPVQLVTSSTTAATPAPTSGSSAIGHPDNYGCTIDEIFYTDGAKVPGDPNKPCELCYCIRNRTACVMQECTLHVEGCRPIYADGVCCPVRYDCDYLETTEAALPETTAHPTPGLILTTTPGPLDCQHDNEVFTDGAMLPNTNPCEFCYCMKGDIVCAVQECGPTPLEREGKNCTALPPQPGSCCPQQYQCDNGTLPLNIMNQEKHPDGQEQSSSSGNDVPSTQATPVEPSDNHENDINSPGEAIIEHITPDEEQAQKPIESEKPIDEKIPESVVPGQEHIDQIDQSTNGQTEINGVAQESIPSSDDSPVTQETGKPDDGTSQQQSTIQPDTSDSVIEHEQEQKPDEIVGHKPEEPEQKPEDHGQEPVISETIVPPSEDKPNGSGQISTSDNKESFTTLKPSLPAEPGTDSADEQNDVSTHSPLESSESSEEEKPQTPENVPDDTPSQDSQNEVTTVTAEIVSHDGSSETPEAQLSEQSTQPPPSLVTQAVELETLAPDNTQPESTIPPTHLPTYDSDADVQPQAPQEDIITGSPTEAPSVPDHPASVQSEHDSSAIPEVSESTLPSIEVTTQGQQEHEGPVHPIESDSQNINIPEEPTQTTLTPQISFGEPDTVEATPVPQEEVSVSQQEIHPEDPVAQTTPSAPEPVENEDNTIQGTTIIAEISTEKPSQAADEISGTELPQTESPELVGGVKPETPGVEGPSEHEESNIHDSYTTEIAPQQPVVAEEDTELQSTPEISATGKPAEHMPSGTTPESNIDHQIVEQKPEEQHPTSGDQLEVQKPEEEIQGTAIPDLTSIISSDAATASSPSTTESSATEIGTTVPPQHNVTPEKEQEISETQTSIQDDHMEATVPPAQKPESDNQIKPQTQDDNKPGSTLITEADHTEKEPENEKIPPGEDISLSTQPPSSLITQAVDMETPAPDNSQPETTISPTHLPTYDSDADVQPQAPQEDIITGSPTEVPSVPDHPASVQSEHDSSAIPEVSESTLPSIEVTTQGQQEHEGPIHPIESDSQNINIPEEPTQTTLTPQISFGEPDTVEATTVPQEEVSVSQQEIHPEDPVAQTTPSAPEPVENEDNTIQGTTIIAQIPTEKPSQAADEISGTELPQTESPELVGGAKPETPGAEGPSEHEESNIHDSYTTEIAPQQPVVAEEDTELQSSPEISATEKPADSESINIVTTISSTHIEDQELLGANKPTSSPQEITPDVVSTSDHSSASNIPELTVSGSSEESISGSTEPSIANLPDQETILQSGQVSQEPTEYPQENTQNPISAAPADTEYATEAAIAVSPELTSEPQAPTATIPDVQGIGEQTTSSSLVESEENLPATSVEGLPTSEINKPESDELPTIPEVPSTSSSVSEQEHESTTVIEKQPDIEHAQEETHSPATETILLETEKPHLMVGQITDAPDIVSQGEVSESVILPDTSAPDSAPSEAVEGTTEAAVKVTESAGGISSSEIPSGGMAGVPTAAPEKGPEGMSPPGVIPEHGVVPGEGYCLVEGQTYQNNSVIPPMNPCVLSCRCVSSIIHCVKVTCSPPPKGHKNCIPVKDKSDACCDTYLCDGDSTPSLESDSHIAGGATMGEEKHPDSTQQPTDEHVEPTSSPEKPNESSSFSPEPVEAEMPINLPNQPEIPDQEHTSEDHLPPSQTPIEADQNPYLPIATTPGSSGFESPTQSSVHPDLPYVPEQITNEDNILQETEKPGDIGQEHPTPASEQVSSSQGPLLQEKPNEQEHIPGTEYTDIVQEQLTTVKPLENGNTEHSVQSTVIADSSLTEKPSESSLINEQTEQPFIPEHPGIPETSQTEKPSESEKPILPIEADTNDEEYIGQQQTEPPNEMDTPDQSVDSQIVESSGTEKPTLSSTEKTEVSTSTHIEHEDQSAVSETEISSTQGQPLDVTVPNEILPSDDDDTKLPSIDSKPPHDNVEAIESESTPEAPIGVEGDSITSTVQGEDISKPSENDIEVQKPGPTQIGSSEEKIPSSEEPVELKPEPAQTERPQVEDTQTELYHPDQSLPEQTVSGSGSSQPEQPHPPSSHDESISKPSENDIQVQTSTISSNISEELGPEEAHTEQSQPQSHDQEGPKPSEEEVVQEPTTKPIEHTDLQAPSTEVPQLETQDSVPENVQPQQSGTEINLPDNLMTESPQPDQTQTGETSQLGNEQSPMEVSSSEQPVPAETEQPALTGSEQPVVAEPGQPALTENEQSALAETEKPVLAENEQPTIDANDKPTIVESEQPVVAETEEPAHIQTEQPTVAQTEQPSVAQTEEPSVAQTEQPSVAQTEQPSVAQTEQPSVAQTEQPSVAQTEQPSVAQTEQPSVAQTEQPSVAQTEQPSVAQTEQPSVAQTEQPSVAQTEQPSVAQTEQPSVAQTEKPSVAQTEQPLVAQTEEPSVSQTEEPSVAQTEQPSVAQTEQPSIAQTEQPSVAQTEQPSVAQTEQPSLAQTEQPSVAQTEQPSVSQTQQPSLAQTEHPLFAQTEQPSFAQTEQPALAENEQPKPQEPLHEEQTQEAVTDDHPQKPEESFEPSFQEETSTLAQDNSQKPEETDNQKPDDTSVIPGQSQPTVGPVEASEFESSTVLNQDSFTTQEAHHSSQDGGYPTEENILTVTSLPVAHPESDNLNLEHVSEQNAPKPEDQSSHHTQSILEVDSTTILSPGIDATENPVTSPSVIEQDTHVHPTEHNEFPPPHKPIDSETETSNIVGHPTEQVPSITGDHSEVASHPLDEETEGIHASSESSASTVPSQTEFIQPTEYEQSPELSTLPPQEVAEKLPSQDSQKPVGPVEAVESDNQDAETSGIHPDMDSGVPTEKIPSDNSQATVATTEAFIHPTTINPEESEKPQEIHFSTEIPTKDQEPVENGQKPEETNHTVPEGVISGQEVEQGEGIINQNSSAPVLPQNHENEDHSEVTDGPGHVATTTHTQIFEEPTQKPIVVEHDDTSEQQKPVGEDQTQEQTSEIKPGEGSLDSEHISSTTEKDPSSSVIDHETDISHPIDHAQIPGEGLDVTTKKPSESHPDVVHESNPAPVDQKPQQPSHPGTDYENMNTDDGWYPPSTDEDWSEGSFGPGTCRYGGKLYVSAQQIPRDDPCDFCFCFRSDIICLRQSCPPPIPDCHQEPIEGFCCPRYQCEVSTATMVNVSTTTTTTTTTLPPHFLSHAYQGAAMKTGCMLHGKSYKIGEKIPEKSTPCLECLCGGDGEMQCNPKDCQPEPMLRKMIMAAASRRR